MNSESPTNDPLQQATSLSQLAVDETSNQSDQMTNQRMDERMAHQSLPRRLSTSTNESDISTGYTRPWTEGSPFNYVFAANRDEQSNNRIAHPMADLETIFTSLLHPNLTRLIFNLIADNTAFGIQDTEPHTLIIPVFVNTIQRDIIIDNENGDTNEDGTVLNDTDDIDEENMNSTTTMIERDYQMDVRESTGVELTGNTNPSVSNDTQDHSYSNMNTDDGMSFFFRCLA